MFEMDGVQLEFTDDALDAIADQAIRRGTGARGLRAILEEVLLNTMFDSWAPYLGPMIKRPNGAIVADRPGTTTPYALFHLAPRGILFVGAGVQTYEGMIMGEHNRENDLDVNIVREKKLTNIRAAGKDENVVLSPPRVVTIEGGLEWIDGDELLECNRRPKRVVN